ncbi:NAD(P)H-binding protein [Novacetimonas hansenii]|uniref:NmrA family transcriptional regulator n=2 Tax=Novacetimonas hansenii TaxID=436 RepID=A0ABQ0SIX9_NOVHA|nr:NAD(P)H-binding protein [Novacetimonas hansenii]EFG84886.1 hypothetical protein GXY_06078 [Novacetimonas hansenii ATCC 23769]GAN82539.1 transcriptional regulator NmrA/oxidoreductase [Novacetimonas hansenii JCM 7643]GBQ60675.1 putative nucleoside-diphosphate-sugar epimerase [Novacetimonas hansenii NRIC 0243]GEC65172.1 NmrA family transcriptional regulator [Novacetimonas hansenii]
MIIITGASGQLGRQIVDHLLTCLPAAQIGVSVRDPAKAADLVARGVRVRQGDFTAPKSLYHSFEGASQVLIVSVNALEGGANAHANAIAAAKTVGVGRILYTSHVDCNPVSPFLPAQMHATTEHLLAETGIPYTSLRNGFYASAAIQLLGPFLQTGQVIVPESGPIAWAHVPDLAQAAAYVLTHEGEFEGATRPLTAEPPLDFTTIIEMASELAGRQIEQVVVSDETYHRSLVSNGAPEPMAAMVLSTFKAARAGFLSPSAGVLEHILGRSPVSIRDLLASHIASQA